jgi:hypothetical protein
VLFLLSVNGALAPSLAASGSATMTDNIVVPYKHFHEVAALLIGALLITTSAQ